MILIIVCYAIIAGQAILAVAHGQVGENSAYYEKAQTVQFTLDGIRCALFPDQIQAAQFSEREQALTFEDRLIEFLNDLDQKKDAIEPDYSPVKQISVLDILKLLPKTNCKECGYPTCMAFASVLSRGETDTSNCPELENSDNEKAEKL